MDGNSGCLQILLKCDTELFTIITLCTHASLSVAKVTEGGQRVNTFVMLTAIVTNLY